MSTNISTKVEEVHQTDLNQPIVMQPEGDRSIQLDQPPSGNYRIKVIIFGLPGMGKSATGNSMLGRTEFVSKGGGNSVTKDLFNACRTFEGDILEVVDTPGFRKFDDEEQMAIQFSEALTRALRKFPQGFNAALLVVSYRQRNTNDISKQNKALVELLTETCFKENGILVITDGDTFKWDGYDNTDIKTWIRNGDQPYKWMLELCSNRCVLFNNRTADKKEQENQLRKLLIEIKTIENPPFQPSIYIDKSRENQQASTFNEMESIDFKLGMLKQQVLDYNENETGMNHCEIIRKMVDHSTELKTRFERPITNYETLSRFSKNELLHFVNDMQTWVDEAQIVEINRDGTFWNKVKKGLYKVLTVSGATLIALLALTTGPAVVDALTAVAAAGGVYNFM